MIDRARESVEDFAADPDMRWLREHLRDARAVLVVPQLFKGAFIFGGSGGSAVLVARDPATGAWSEPAFYTMGSVSWGLQIGGQESQVVMLIMSNRGLEALYTSTVKLGADASAAVGPVGAGAQGATAMNLSADYVWFSRSKGAFVGLSLDGAIIKANDKANSAYYGRSVRPVDILARQEVSNPKSADLYATLARLVQ